MENGQFKGDAQYSSGFEGMMVGLKYGVVKTAPAPSLLTTAPLPDLVLEEEAALRVETSDLGKGFSFCKWMEPPAAPPWVGNSSFDKKATFAETLSSAELLGRPPDTSLLFVSKEPLLCPALMAERFGGAVGEGDACVLKSMASQLRGGQAQSNAHYDTLLKCKFDDDDPL
jgi:hypothetical protein